MFGFSKKKDKKKGRGRDSEENEFGIKLDQGPDDKQLEAELKKLAGVDGLPEDDLNLNEGEEDVESELLRLIGGGRGKRAPKKPTNPDEPLGDITDLTAEIDLGDEDVEVDENDEELLGELLELTNPDEGIAEEEEEVESDNESGAQPSNGEPDIMTTLKERLKLYKTAEAKAKENNESSRARRFSRGIKTLEDLLKKAKAGKPVSPGDIPPEIALNLKPAPPPEPVIPEVANGTPDPESEDSPIQNSNQPAESDIMSTLRERLEMYKTAEAKAKESGETTRARRFGRGIRTLEGLIKQARAGGQVSPEEIPPAVALNLKPAPPVPPPSEETEDEMGNVSLVEEQEHEQEPEPEPEPEKSPEQERNILDVLSERLQMYKTAEAKAKENAETSRARRFGRGIKTLQDLIKQATAGKPIPFEDIPPEIALNLKPAPIVTTQEESIDTPMERENLVRSSNDERVLSFAPVDDVDLNEELGEEEEEEDLATTVLEGLEQRVRLYTKFQEKAKQEGNSASSDQYERIVRVYLNAIRTYKKGEFVDVERLPNPRGCPPIPIPFFVP